MVLPEYSKYFDAYYYAHCCGQPYQRNEIWLGFFDSIARRIVEDIRPSTVLDVGCAWGFLVEKLRQRGVEAYGLDISEYAIQNVQPEMRPFCWIGSAVDPLPRDYDLIVSIEVLEHMPKGEAEKAVQIFCERSQAVLFSSTPFNYGEVTHFNVQPPEYWGELFARHGFYRDVDFDASLVTPWAVLYRRNLSPFSTIARDYERKYFFLWKENVDLRSLAVQMRDETTELGKRIEDLTQMNAHLERELTHSSSQLQDIFSSRGWRFLNILYRIRLALAPHGSWMERLLFKK
jgi:SAM-dependent methyltransferase